MMADGDPEKLPLPGAPPDKVRAAISTLYSEWEQVQTERQQWQLERAQMRAKILTLESNARTHQQVRLDLIRRIKLLEHGLMQERRNFLSRRPPSKFVTHFLHHDEFRYGGGHLYTRANEHEHKASSSSKDRASKPRKAYYRTLPASAFSGKDLRDTTPARQFLREYLIELGYLQEVASLDSSLQTAHGSASYVPPTPTTKGRPSSIATLSRQNSSEWKAGDSPPIKDDVQVSSSGSFAKPRKTGSHLRRGSRSDIMESKSHSKTWKSMYSLRSHLDGVRAVQFLDEAPGLLTASEDGAVKLWNLSSLLDPNDHKAKKKLLEPIYTFRGHSGMVTSLQTSAKRSECYSAGVDGSVIVWQLPELSQDPYGADGSAKRFRKYILDGHSDAVWNLEVHPALGLLFSAGADGAVGVWKLAELGTEHNMGAVTSMSLKIEYTSKDQVTQVPTSCQVFPSDMNKLVVGYTSGEVVVADIETGKIVRVMRSRVDNDQSNPHVTALQCHKTLTLAATAHLDTNVRLFDINQGACVDVIQTHRDAVTDVSIDPSGLYLASCSHDQSIRFWDLTSKKVIQDLDAYHTHRKKYDEAIHTVQYHPSLPLVASGGADSVIKLYE